MDRVNSAIKTVRLGGLEFHSLIKIADTLNTNSSPIVEEPLRIKK